MNARPSERDAGKTSGWKSFRGAVLSGIAVVLPPLLTVVIFIWIWGTLDAYVLTYVEAGFRKVLVRQYIDEIESFGPADPRPERREIDGRYYRRVTDGDYVPEEIYEEVKTYLAGEEMPKSAVRVLDLYVTARHLKPQVVVPVFLCVFILLMYLLGKLMAAGAGSFVWGTFEGGVRRLPLVRNVYSSVKQVTDFMLSKSELSFSRVVACEYPRKGIWSVGFVMGEGLIDVTSAAGEPVISVLMPTSPMPVTGYVMMFRRSDVLDLKLTIEEALEYIVSCGVVVAPHQLQSPENLARLRGTAVGQDAALVAASPRNAGPEA